MQLVIYGITALMLASMEGYTEIVGLIISKGADVNTVDNDGNTALMLASVEGHTETAGLLISKGADVNVVGNDGDPPLTCLL